eukprot:TRINITY_DN30907_c0_g1_i1.p1 TRINITY_DN30907_c0_g1~~TRINITY_DN30907_c0_g1_i1.p1  ORF type:complete len:924 (-),score=208.05 TRINITY_DN30907_c0_g1_i1:176-2947(-)
MARVCDDMTSDQEEARGLLSNEHKPTSTKLRVGKLREGNIKYAGHHQKWSSYIGLALTVSGFVCLFGLPAFSQAFNWLVFGEKERIVSGREVSMCTPNMFGFKTNAGSPAFPNLINFNLDDLKAGRKPDVWCGVLAGKVFEYWPGVVVAVFFQATSSTGSTVRSCFNGVVGTFLACFNIFVLTQFYSQGARSPNYEEWICWVDVVVITMGYLYLNTLFESITRMGLLFHLSMMMNFMNPSKGVQLGTWSVGIPGIILHWDDEVILNIATAMIGSIISIIPTLMGKKRLNISHAEEDANTIVQALDTIWDDSIVYFGGSKTTGKKNQIAKKFDLLQGGVSRIQSDLDNAWWETFGVGRRAHVRDLYKFFSSTAKELNDELHCMLTSITAMKFSDRHVKFAADLKTTLQELEEKAVGLLALCVSCCSDGVVTLEEQEEIEKGVERITKLQHSLLEELDGAAHTEELLSSELGSATTFVYAVSASVRRVTEFAHLLPRAVKKESFCSSMTDVFTHKVLSIFDPKVVFDGEHMLVATANFVPIMITFVMGYYLDDSVFTPFNASMAVNLALLFKFERVATFHLNLQRLLGVTLGLVLPKLVMAFVQMWSCEDIMRTVTQASMVFVYFFIFAYGTYTSPQWSFVFCIIGGSGGSLMEPCRDENFSIEYSAGYRSIAMVTIAVFIRMISDSIILQKKPREFATSEMRTLLRALEEALAAFLRGDLAAATQSTAAAKTSLASCESMAPKADPNLKIVKGRKADFKIDLFKGSLESIRGLVSDFELLLLASCDWVPLHGVELATAVSVDEMSRLDGILNDTPSFKLMAKSLTTRLQTAGQALMIILEHDKETRIEDEIVKRLEDEEILELPGGDKVYQELRRKVYFETAVSDNKQQLTNDKRARLSVIVSAMQSAARHCGEVDALCLAECL